MNKILFISSRPIYPISGGDQIRTAQQLELLTKYFDVDVLYLSPNLDDPSLDSYIHGIGKTYRFHIGKLRHYVNTLSFLFNRLPLQVNYYLDRKIAHVINAMIDDYDAVFCNNIRMAEYVRKTKVVKYLDFVDAISMNYDKARKKARGLKRMIYELDFHRCRTYEQFCLRDFDSCGIISDIDKNYILTCAR